MGVHSMKRLTIYAISFLSLSVVLTTCYFVSYRYAVTKYDPQATKHSGITRSATGAEARNASSDSKTIVAVDAEYVEQICDIATDKQKENKKNIPNDFVGLTREEVISCLNGYMSNKSLEELNKGLVSWELVSFAADKVVVKKTYNSKGVIYKYYMAIRDNNVVVYYSDKKTVFDDETGINLDDISLEDKRELLYGKWIQNEDELYGVIEGYTS